MNIGRNNINLGAENEFKYYIERVEIEITKAIILGVKLSLKTTQNLRAVIENFSATLRVITNVSLKLEPRRNSMENV